MARVITDECVSCGTCVGECPVDAISEGDGKYEIAADTCVDCGACEDACPQELLLLNNSGTGTILFKHIKKRVSRVQVT